MHPPTLIRNRCCGLFSAIRWLKNVLRCAFHKHQKRARSCGSEGAPLDGLNDTVALASAHVSISPATALDAARAASDMVLLGRDLAPLPDAMETAKRARARIKENFTLATAYNVIAVPIAAAGFATPLVAALAMSTSSITVSLNALRLRG